jgi:hypothetical protein
MVGLYRPDGVAGQYETDFAAPRVPAAIMTSP